MEIGRFYMARGQWLAANMRFRQVIDQYQTTTHAPEALMRLTETSLQLGMREEAKKSAAVLGANYPGTDWYERAYKIMGENPVKPIAPVPTGTPIVPDGTPGVQASSLPGESTETPRDAQPAGSTPAPTADPATSTTTVGPNPTVTPASTAPTPN